MKSGLTQTAENRGPRGSTSGGEGYLDRGQHTKFLRLTPNRIVSFHWVATFPKCTSLALSSFFLVLRVGICRIARQNLIPACVCSRSLGRGRNASLKPHLSNLAHIKGRCKHRLTSRSPRRAFLAYKARLNYSNAVKTYVKAQEDPECYWQPNGCWMSDLDCCGTAPVATLNETNTGTNRSRFHRQICSLKKGSPIATEAAEAPRAFSTDSVVRNLSNIYWK